MRRDEVGQNRFMYCSCLLLQSFFIDKKIVEVRQGIGTVAQLVERMFRIYEARGSTPLCSTFLATDPRNTAQDLS